MFSGIFLRSVALVAVTNSHSNNFHLDERFERMGLDCLRQTYDLLVAPDWKIEKVTKRGDAVVSSLNREGLGKIYKVTCRVKYPAKALCNEIFNKFENLPQWNPTVLKSEIIEKINNFTDIAYSITSGYCGGIIKSRDFVTLRCCRLVENDQITDENLVFDHSEEEALKKLCENSISEEEEALEKLCENNRLSTTDVDPIILPRPSICDTTSMNLINDIEVDNVKLDLMQLDLEPHLSPKEEKIKGEQENLSELYKTNNSVHKCTKNGRVWISAAISVDYDKAPPVTPNYIRGQSYVSGFGMHELEGYPNECIFEYIVCVDFKGSVPRSLYNMNEEYTQKALECVRRTYQFLEADDWTVEKVTQRDETISSIYREGFGKIYKLTCSLKYPAEALCYEIFRNIENVPDWNQQMLESRVKRRFNSYTEISKQTLRWGRGFITREFVNLCCWRLLVNGEIQEKDMEIHSVADDAVNNSAIFQFTDEKLESHQHYRKNGRVWLNAAVDEEYEGIHVIRQHVRGENLVSGFAAYEVEEQPDVCIFEWILCIDLKGFIPRYLMDKCYTSFMADYMTYLLKHVDELRQEHIKK